MGLELGLELFEFLCRVKVVFAINLSAREMEDLESPAEVIDYVWARIPHGSHSGCLSQKAFYRIRRLICETLGVERQSVSRNTFFADIVSSPVDNDSLHNVLAKEFDAAHLPVFTRTRKKRFLEVVSEFVRNVVNGKKWFFEDVADFVENLVTIRLSILGVTELVGYLVAERPFLLKPKCEGWSRREVGEVIKKLTLRELCVNYPSETDRFAEDLGVTE